MERFSYETNGYNRSEVNQFVDEVIKETEAVILRVKKQNVEIEKLQKEIELYRSAINDISVKAIKAEVKNEIDFLAKKESEMIITNARKNASRIVNEALIKAYNIEKSTVILEKNIILLKKNLKNIVKKQMSEIDKIDILDINLD